LREHLPYGEQATTTEDDMRTVTMGATTDERARENREYVRGLLRSRQPRFATALETAVQELLDVAHACR
jgi:hypothetical protein